MSEVVTSELDQFVGRRCPDYTSGSKWLKETGKTLGNKIKERRSQGVGRIKHIRSLMEEPGRENSWKLKAPLTLAVVHSSDHFCPHCPPGTPTCSHFLTRTNLSLTSGHLHILFLLSWILFFQMFHSSLPHFIQVSAPTSPRQLSLTSLPQMATLNFDPSLEPLICFHFPSEHLAQPKVIVHAYFLYVHHTTRP